jgi:hypothetical protein
MDKLKQNVKMGLWAIWLSGSLTWLTGLNFLDLKWWAIILPTIILNVIFNNNNNK